MLQAPTLDPEVKNKIHKKGKKSVIWYGALFVQRTSGITISDPLMCLRSGFLNPTNCLVATEGSGYSGEYLPFCECRMK